MAASTEVTRSIALSGTHGCALRQAGLYCWGRGFAGQLGNASTDDSELPVPATVAGDDIVEVAASTGRTCVRRSTGEVACWGVNDLGQIGDGTRRDALLAEAAIDIDDALQLAVDDGTTCVLRASGEVACWGGSPGGSPDDGSVVPELIAGLSDIVELRGAVLDTYCARDAEGAVYCFELDDGDWTEPARVAGLERARAIAVTGYNVMCALTEAQSVACYNLESGVTTPLEQSDDSVALIGTSLVACAHQSSGGWTCWNILPPMLESVGSPPLFVPEGEELVEVAIGGFRVCAVRRDDSVVCANAELGTVELVVLPGLPP
jgi:hypothetical protein